MDISSMTWVWISGERLPQISRGRLGMEHLALFGQLDYSLQGQLSRWECQRRGRREVRGPQFDADGHVAAVGDMDVPHQAGRVVDREDLEPAPEERMGRIGDLNLLDGSFPLRVI